MTGAWGIATMSKQGAPLRTRVERRLPALSSLRGQNPAQVGVGDKPRHIHPDLGHDDMRGHITDSGHRGQQLHIE